MRWIILAAVIAFVIWFVQRRRQRSGVPVASRSIDPAQPAPPFALQNGEILIYEASVTVETVHKVTEHVGGYSGLSFRVARGLYLRSGGMRGHSVSHDAIQADDSGTIYVTSARVIFVGVRCSVEFDRDKILDVTCYTDGVTVARSNAKTIVLLTDSPTDLATALTHRTSPADVAAPNLGADIAAVANSATASSLSLHLQITGPVEKMTAALDTLHDSTAEIVEKFGDDLQGVRARKPLPGAQVIQATEALQRCQSSVSELKQALATYETTASNSASIDAFDSIISSFFQTLVAIDAEMRSMNLPTSFAPAIAGLEQMLSEVHDDCAKWPEQIVEVRKAITAGGASDLTLTFNLDLPAFAGGIAASVQNAAAELQSHAAPPS